MTACLLAFILPVASTGSVSLLADRLEGWWLASVASTAAVLLLSSRSPGDKLRAQAAKSAAALARQLERADVGTVTAADAEAAKAAKDELMNTFVATPYRLLAIGTNPVALWIAFPLAVLVAAYTPGTAPFAAGQAAFTITVVVLFTLLVPAGWRVGLLRVEDVAWASSRTGLTARMSRSRPASGWMTRSVAT